MEIIIKKKIPSMKETMDSEGVKILTPILSVYFDVLTPDTAYVDNNDIGYFPIETVADMNTPDADIIAACEKWIIDNDVLSHYAGKLRNRDEDIAIDIASEYPLPAEMALHWKLHTGELTMNSPEIVAFRAKVESSKIKYPKGVK